MLRVASHVAAAELRAVRVLSYVVVVVWWLICVQASAIDLQTAPGGLLHGVVDRAAVEQRLAGSSSGAAAPQAQ